MSDLLIARGKGSIIKLKSNKQAHYLPISITENPNYPLKFKESDIVELYEDHIIIRPKIEGET